MSRAGRPAVVRRWARRPLWWAAAATALSCVLFVADVNAARSSDRTYDDGYRVGGEVTSGWDGGRDVFVIYRHPATGELVDAATYVWDDSRLPTGPGPVALEVSRSDPKDVALAGDRFPATANLANYVPLALFPFFVWLIRRWTLRRTERLMASEAPAFLMQANASPPSWWGRRWHLRLYALDSGPAGRCVCTVPLVAAPSQVATFPVEVKGAPRPYARVVARCPEGEVLWPSGRALRSHGRPAAAIARLVPTAASTAASRLALGGVALLVGGVIAVDLGTYADDVRERQEVVTAVVTGIGGKTEGRVKVSVAYGWAGSRYSGTVTEASAPGEGSSLRVRVDPRSPRRVWSTSQDHPPGTNEGEVGGLLILLALGLLAAAAIAWLQAGRQPSGSHAEQAWRGLELIDRRLWYDRQPRLLRRPSARFDPDALVLVDPDGSEAAFTWDDHANAAAPRTASTWHLEGVRPSRYNTAVVWLHVGREATGDRTSRRLAGWGWSDTLWEELPALAAYVAATPAARAGLADPDRTSALISALATRGWRRPRPPGEPMLGDRLDLHRAVDAVLARRIRRFGGRPVRGEALPPIEQLVAEVTARLPEWVRPRVTPDMVAERVRRHLSTGRWPFDVLLLDNLADQEQAG